jgi:ubiquinone/menaquinone biosynthesis C-methylase UbiE
VLSSRYERRWYRYLQASIDRTLDDVELAPGQCLLDLGCGTGLMLARLARRYPEARLLGSDLSEDMLAIARERLAPTKGLFQAAIEVLPIADRSVDALVSTSVFHFVQRPSDALSEMYRVLKPGGRLVITDWCRDFMSMRLFDTYLKALGRPHHHTCSSDEFANLLDLQGFARIRLSSYRIDWFWGLFTANAVRPKD